MKTALRSFAMFAVVLFASDWLIGASQRYLQDRYISDITSDAGGWLSSYGHMELTELLVTVATFLLGGAVLTRLIPTSALRVLPAFLLGLAYVILHLALSPMYPLARYSHAPTWLWLLFWATYFVPPFAGAIGAWLAITHSPRAQAT